MTCTCMLMLNVCTCTCKHSGLVRTHFLPELNLNFCIICRGKKNNFCNIKKAQWLKLPTCELRHYYMASSMSRQDEPNHALWLATRAGKMELQYLACSGLLKPGIQHEKFPWKPYTKSFIDHAFLVKIAGYWPRSFLVSLWTLTPSQSTNTQRKNLANIQPSWPHAWLITHIYLKQTTKPFLGILIIISWGLN